MGTAKHNNDIQLQRMGGGDVAVAVCLTSEINTVDSAVSIIGEEEIEVRLGEDGFLSRNLAAASETFPGLSPAR
jgi:hypothetical protein